MLKTLVTLAVVLSAAIARPAPEPPVHWVWSGAITSRSAVVKAKVDSETKPVNLRLSDRLISDSARSENGIVVFTLEGLTPGTQYTYRIEVGGTPSLSGRFRTFAEGPMSFRFVFGSCAKTGSNHRIFETMRSLDPLFTLHMGDFHYENIEGTDPGEFRHAFDKVLASERQSALYRSAAIAYVWDDHDYGPNDSDGTHPGKAAALAAYDEVVPHYPLQETGGGPVDVHQAFSAGRVRFLLTDVRSHRTPDSEPDGPNKTMLGEAQREWLLREMQRARDAYALVIWVNAVPWIAEPGSGHGWGRYDFERRFIADRIRELGMTNRLLMLSGDAHMVAMDDGTHSNFAAGAPAGERGFPVVHAAPLDRYARHKGGPYSHGKAGRRVLFGLIPIQQFGLADVRDDGKVLEIDLSGRDENGELLEGMWMTLRCADDECRVAESRDAP